MTVSSFAVRIVLNNVENGTSACTTPSSAETRDGQTSTRQNRPGLHNICLPSVVSSPAHRLIVTKAEPE